MRHRDFHQACCAFNWGWKDHTDPHLRSAGRRREHELRAIASEADSLMRILVRAEAAYWQRQVHSAQEVSRERLGSRV